MQKILNRHFWSAFKVVLESWCPTWYSNIKWTLKLIDFYFHYSHFVPQFNIHFWRWWTTTMTPIGMPHTMLEIVLESPILIFMSLELQVILNQIEPKYKFCYNHTKLQQLFVCLIFFLIQGSLLTRTVFVYELD